MDDNITVEQAAEILGISRYRVYRLIIRGDLAAQYDHEGGFRYRITRRALDAVIANGARLSPPRAPHADLLRVAEVAMMTGYDVTVIRAMCRSGQLEYEQCGDRGHYRIYRSSVEKFLND